MKQFILLALFINQLLANPPSWYINQTLLSKSYEIVGYGEGLTLEEVKQVSKSDISKMIQTTISSNISINKNMINDIYSKNISTNINEKSDILLTNLKVMKISFSDDKYYIAIKYINLPFAKKVKLLIEDIDKLSLNKNKYLNKTPLMNELKQEFGFYPKVSLDKNNIIINNQSFHLSQNDFIKLLVNIENKNIKLDIKDNYKNKEYYFIKVKTFKSGYLNIFQVYQSGETILLLANKKVVKNTNIIYPNHEEYDGLEAIVPKGQDKTKDLTFVTLCKDKKDFSMFDSVDTNINTKDLYFGKLLFSINDCTIVSKVIKVHK